MDSIQTLPLPSFVDDTRPLPADTFTAPNLEQSTPDGALILPADINIGAARSRALLPSLVDIVLALCGHGTRGREAGKPIGQTIGAIVDERAPVAESTDRPSILDRWIESGETVRGTLWHRVRVNPIGAGGSIYGLARVNLLYRAHHDLTHVHTAADFTMTGETTVAFATIEEAAALGADPATLLLLAIDGIGSRAYYARSGYFPADPVAFAREVMGRVPSYGIHAPRWRTADERRCSLLIVADVASELPA
jgi:hypothetical protein